jgi:hypothetical protein
MPFEEQIAIRATTSGLSTGGPPHLMCGHGRWSRTDSRIWNGKNQQLWMLAASIAHSWVQQLCPREQDIESFLRMLGIKLE